MNKPEVTLLQKGVVFKILQVTGEKDMLMPKHISTKEAVIVIAEGYAIIEIASVEHLLKKGDSIIIPATAPHSLLVITSFKAIVMMPVESEIEYIN
jgi:quercetin dioxygenase-like cupin family protein